MLCDDCESATATHADILTYAERSCELLKKPSTLVRDIVEKLNKLDGDGCVTIADDEYGCRCSSGDLCNSAPRRPVTSAHSSVLIIAAVTSAILG